MSNNINPHFTIDSVEYANAFFSRLNSDVLPNDAALASINYENDTLTFFDGDIGITAEPSDDDWYQLRVWYTEYSTDSRWVVGDAWDVDLVVLRGRTVTNALAELAAFVVKKYLLNADADEALATIVQEEV